MHFRGLHCHFPHAVRTHAQRGAVSPLVAPEGPELQVAFAGRHDQVGAAVLVAVVGAHEGVVLRARAPADAAHLRRRAVGYGVI